MGPRIHNNRKRRLAARGGRRKAQTVFLTTPQQYFVRNTATGNYSLEKKGGEYIPEKTIPASTRPKQIGRRFFYDQQLAVPEKVVYRKKTLTCSVRVAV